MRNWTETFKRSVSVGIFVLISILLISNAYADFNFRPGFGTKEQFRTPASRKGSRSSTTSPEDMRRQKENRERELRKKESQQRVERVDTIIREGDGYFSDFQYDAAIRAYQRVVDMHLADNGLDLILSGTRGMYDHAVEQIKFIEEKRKLDAEEANREYVRNDEKAKITGMLDDLAEEFDASNSQGASMDFFGAFEDPPGEIYLEAEERGADAQPAAAIREAESAAAHGERASGDVTSEEAKSEASKVFDQPGKSVPETITFPDSMNAGAVDARDVMPYEVPLEIRETREWKDLEQRENKISEEHERKRKTVDDLTKKYEEQKDALSPAQRGELQVQLAREKQSETDLKAQLNAVKSEKKQFATWNVNTQPDPTLLEKRADE